MVMRFEAAAAAADNNFRVMYWEDCSKI